MDEGLAGISGVARIMENPVGRILGPMILSGLMGYRYVNTAEAFAVWKWSLEPFPSLKRVFNSV